MLLKSAWTCDLFAGQVLLGLCLVLCFANVAAADFEADLANMSADQAYRAAAVLAKSGQTDQAIKGYEFVADFHPDDDWAPWALCGLAQILCGRGESEEPVAHLQQALNRYPTSKAVTRGDVPLLLTSLLLHRMKDCQGAVDVAKSALEKFSAEMRPRDRGLLIGRLAEAYMQLGDNAAAEQLLTSQLPTCPYLLTNTTYYDFMVKIQIAKKDFAAALSMAKAGYALCDFNETAIKDMANLVRRVLVAKGEFAKGTQFLAAQEDVQKSNPLRDVPMPVVPEEVRQQLLQAASNDPALLCRVYLYAGDHASALEHAMAYMAEASADKAVKALMEVARVFKAADLNLVRANQFINYAKTGEGENPLAEGTL